MDERILNQILGELKNINDRLTNLEQGQEKIIEVLEINRMGKKTELDSITEKLNFLDDKLIKVDKKINTIESSTLFVEDKVADINEFENNSEDIV